MAGFKVIIEARLAVRDLKVLPHFRCKGQAACRTSQGSTRALSSSNPARPYIWRLMAFSRLICPSVGLHSNPGILPDIQEATIRSVKELDQSFFRVRFDRLTPREKDYLRALAALGRGPQRSGDVAEILGV